MSVHATLPRLLADCADQLQNYSRRLEVDERFCDPDTAGLIHIQRVLLEHLTGRVSMALELLAEEHGGS